MRHTTGQSGNKKTTKLEQSWRKSLLLAEEIQAKKNPKNSIIRGLYRHSDKCRQKKRCRESKQNQCQLYSLQS